MLNEEKISLAKDIVFNSSDIETIIAVNYLKKIKQFELELNKNKFNISKLDRFIKNCIIRYEEVIEIIQNDNDSNIYLYKKDFYLKRLDLIESAIYTHILLIKGKIDDVYDIMYSI